jgi:hypothetical protein
MRRPIGGGRYAGINRSSAWSPGRIERVDLEAVGAPRAEDLHRIPRDEQPPPPLRS